MTFRQYRVTLFTACATALTVGAMARAGAPQHPDDLIYLVVPATMAAVTFAVWLLEKRDSHADNARTKQDAAEKAEDGANKTGASRKAAELPGCTHTEFDPLHTRMIHPLANTQQQQAQTDRDNSAVLGDAASAEDGNACNHHSHPPVFDFDAAHVGSSTSDPNATLAGSKGA